MLGHACSAHRVFPTLTCALQPYGTFALALTFYIYYINVSELLQLAVLTPFLPTLKKQARHDFHDPSSTTGYRSFLRFSPPHRPNNKSQAPQSPQRSFLTMSSMFTLPSIRLPSFGLGSKGPRVELASVEIHDVETAAEKRPRTLKHLLRANHANHSIVYKDGRCRNNTAHVCAYSFTARQISFHSGPARAALFACLDMSPRFPCCCGLLSPASRVLGFPAQEAVSCELARPAS